jgi:sorbitol/mannitol transport system permease protein
MSSSPVAVVGGPAVATAAASAREGWNRRLPLLPALIFVVVMQIPFLYTIYYSLLGWNLNYPDTATKFTGLENYRRLVADPELRIALGNTLVLTVFAVSISVVLGVAIAIILNKEVFGKGVLRTLMIGPFLVMPTAAALIWKHTLLNPLFGLVGQLNLPLFGHVVWTDRLPMGTVVAFEVWRWTPFMMLIVLAGLQSQNLEVLEAARVDGARALQTFRYITLPFIRPFVELGALLGSLFILQTFDSVFIITDGGPGTSTTNIPFLLYRDGFRAFDVSYAAAIGVVSVVVTAIIATFALRTLFSIFRMGART